MATAPLVAAFGSSRTASARTVKLSAPRSPTSGCSLIVTLAISRRTGPRPSVSRSVTTGSSAVTRVGCRVSITWVIVVSSAAPTGCTAPRMRLLNGVSTVPTGRFSTSIWLVSSSGAAYPSTPMNPPTVPESVTGAFTSSVITVTETCRSTSTATSYRPCCTRSTVFEMSEFSPAPVTASVTPSRIAVTVSPCSTSVFSGRLFKSLAPVRSITRLARSTEMVPSFRSMTTLPSAFESGSCSREVRTSVSSGSTSIDAEFREAFTPGSASSEVSRSVSVVLIAPPSPRRSWIGCTAVATVPSTRSISPAAAGLCRVAWTSLSAYSLSRTSWFLAARDPSAPISTEASSTRLSTSSGVSTWPSRSLRSSCAVPYPPLAMSSRFSEPSELMRPLDAVDELALGDSLRLESVPRLPSSSSPRSPALGLMSGRLTVPACSSARPPSTSTLSGSVTGPWVSSYSVCVYPAPATSSPRPSAQSQCP